MNDESRDWVLAVFYLEYEADFLPEEGPLWGDKPLSEEAEQLAAYVCNRVGTDAGLEAAEFIREVALNPDGPWMDVLVRKSRNDWRLDERWTELSKIMLATAEVLSGGPSQTGLSASATAP